MKESVIKNGRTSPVARAAMLELMSFDEESISPTPSVDDKRDSKTEEMPSNTPALVSKNAVRYARATDANTHSLLPIDLLRANKMPSTVSPMAISKRMS